MVAWRACKAGPLTLGALGRALWSFGAKRQRKRKALKAQWLGGWRRGGRGPAIARILVSALRVHDYNQEVATRP